MGSVRYNFLAVILCLSVGVQAQNNDLQDRYNEFKEKAQATLAAQRESDEEAYRKFRAEVNARYAEFLKKAWAEFPSQPAEPIPYEESVVPPPPIPDSLVKPLPVRLKPLPFEVVVLPPKVIEQPLPVVPIKEVPQPEEEWFDFVFYGTECQVRLDDNHKFRFSSISENTIAEQWTVCSEPAYDNVIRDCLALRVKMNLCDYAYLQMLDTLFDQFYGANSNESVFMTAYVYCQSGYKMRFGMSPSNNLLFLYSSRHKIYLQRYFILEGEKFYVYGAEEKECRISSVAYDKEQPMSLVLDSAPLFSCQKSELKERTSSRYPEVSVPTEVNKNLIDFYNTYPISHYSDDIMTQWAIYANTPISDDVKSELYPSMKSKIDGLSQLDAVSRLLNWIQTGFEYSYDKDIWGKERIFFADETLYYQYCDCEDRSILLTRLVRDLLGLNAVLVYYPGHLAAAVAFTEPVNGDYFEFDGEKYVVCDPTYIGASVGETMPQMDNSKAKLIKLR